MFLSPSVLNHRTKKQSLALAATSLLVLSALAIRPAWAQTTLLSQNFDSFTVGSSTDYYTVNNSTNVDTTLSWQNPDTTTVASEFSSFNGASTSYVYSNYQDILSGSGTISTWLITPTLTYQNGDVFSFYTRTTGFTPIFPDRMQVLMSTNGTSTNVGSLPTDIGDFSSVLLDINSAQTTTGYPSIWTQYSITVSGLATPTSGRIAFRYYVTNAGPEGTNSDFIGIDALSVLRPASASTPEPSSLGLLGAGVLFVIARRRARRAAR